MKKFDVKIIEKSNGRGYKVFVEVVNVGINYGTAANLSAENEYIAVDTAHFADAVLSAFNGDTDSADVTTAHSKFGWIVFVRFNGNEFTAVYPTKALADEVAVFVKEILRIAALP